MASFICKVLTPQKQVVKIKMVEEDKIACLKKLKRNGMTPISIKNTIKLSKKNERNTAKIYSKRNEMKQSSIIIQLSNKVTLEELKLFTQDFYLLKKSKFTNEHALKIIISNVKNLEFQKTLSTILYKMKKGIPLYKAMEEYKTIFPFEYIHFIKTGELTNKLEDSLEHAIRYLEDEEELKSKINKILIPNIFMFFSIILMTFLAILIGIPLLKNIFSINGTNSLPNSILFVSWILNKIIKYWYIIAIVTIVGIILFIKFLNTENGRYKFDKIICTNILFGKLMYLLNFSRLIGSVEINLKNNMRIQDALDISKNVIKNTYMLNTLEKSINNIYVGKSWIEPYEKENKLNLIIIEMLKKGNKNDLLQIIERVIQYIDIEVEKEINKLLKILPEISYSIVGIAILMFAITILIPCIQIYLGGFLFI